WHFNIFCERSSYRTHHSCGSPSFGWHSASIGSPSTRHGCPAGPSFSNMTACTILCGRAFCLSWPQYLYASATSGALNWSSACASWGSFCAPPHWSSRVRLELHCRALHSLQQFLLPSPTFRTVSPPDVMARRFGGPLSLLLV